ncbi:hypothetical protein [Thioalkalivibrio sp. ALE28]|uniref:hypothetical protein n=1 Tax=Thioalkalivibrio sp. ALE28 TaxID=1158179 RepID=UPI0012DDC43C|nr:hypothetical protein [Thioalkalivibrio sp. ALE28]
MTRRQAEQVLRDLIVQYGPSLSSETARVKALLLDLCAGGRLEANVLTAVAEEGLAKELLSDAGKTSGSIIIPMLAKRLHEERGTEIPLAEWAVSAWRTALGGWDLEGYPHSASGLDQAKKTAADASAKRRNRSNPSTPAAEAEVITPDMRCRAITEQGRQCRLKADETGVCKRHRKINEERERQRRLKINSQRKKPNKPAEKAEVTTPSMVCRAMTKQGKQCRMRADETGLCEIHRTINGESGRSVDLNRNGQIEFNSSDYEPFRGCAFVFVLLAAFVGSIGWVAYVFATASDEGVSAAVELAIKSISMSLLGAFGLFAIFKVFGWEWVIDKIEGSSKSSNWRRYWTLFWLQLAVLFVVFMLYLVLKS